MSVLLRKKKEREKDPATLLDHVSQWLRKGGNNVIIHVLASSPYVIEAYLFIIFDLQSVFLTFF